MGGTQLAELHHPGETLIPYSIDRYLQSGKVFLHYVHYLAVHKSTLTPELKASESTSCRGLKANLKFVLLLRDERTNIYYIIDDEINRTRAIGHRIKENRRFLHKLSDPERNVACRKTRNKETGSIMAP